jgi:ankyrin repeat protein
MIEEGGALSNNLHTRLYSSALTGDWAAVDQLLAQGADPAWTHTKEGQTVVHVAALQGNVDALLKFHGISERYVSLRDAVRSFSDL